MRTDITGSPMFSVPEPIPAGASQLLEVAVGALLERGRGHLSAPDTEALERFLKEIQIMRSFPPEKSVTLAPRRRGPRLGRAKTIPRSASRLMPQSPPLMTTTAGQVLEAHTTDDAVSCSDQVQPQPRARVKRDRNPCADALDIELYLDEENTGQGQGVMRFARRTELSRADRRQPDRRSRPRSRYRSGQGSDAIELKEALTAECGAGVGHENNK